ncbi:hypothetical protein BGX38DRAFT_328850 [Terfezia claveryi]|nr:hypothetical protein BGX38DRAFT_328850 [Terfezia claveryi]
MPIAYTISLLCCTVYHTPPGADQNGWLVCDSRGYLIQYPARWTQVSEHILRSIYCRMNDRLDHGIGHAICAYTSPGPQVGGLTGAADGVPLIVAQPNQAQMKLSIAQRTYASRRVFTPLPHSPLFSSCASMLRAALASQDGSFVAKQWYEADIQDRNNGDFSLELRRKFERNSTLSKKPIRIPSLKHDISSLMY